MEAPADSTIDDFERWDVPHLKNYLAKRGISQKGKKAELVALAYSCHVMNKSVTDTYTSDIQQAFNDYQEILHLANGIIIPDPFKIKNGWIGEREGMKMWPHICILDIVDHFREQHINTEKLLSEYKSGKAYDYFKTDWLKEIFFNSMEDLESSNTGINKFCLLKAKCTPSQRINDPYHDVWCCAEKDTGKVACAYCNCAAG